MVKSDCIKRFFTRLKQGEIFTKTYSFKDSSFRSAQGVLSSTAQRGLCG